MVRPGDWKAIVAYLSQAFQVSIRRACKTINMAKSMYYYESVKDDSEVIDKLRALAENKPTESQDKLYARIRQQGYSWNYKRVRQVYLLMGLNKRSKRCKRLPVRIKEPLVQTQELNRSWSMDFMHDTLTNGRKFRTLNIIDAYNRKVLAVEADFSFPAQGVVTTLKKVIPEYGKPERIRVDNGPEFISTLFTDWCREQEIKVQHILANLF